LSGTVPHEFVGRTESNETGTGFAVSKGDEGFLMRVTQKHFAMPSSPFIKAMFKPKSFLLFIAPLRTIPLGISSFWVSIGGEII
jgi:hypothetical protein